MQIRQLIPLHSLNQHQRIEVETAIYEHHIYGLGVQLYRIDEPNKPSKFELRSTRSGYMTSVPFKFSICNVCNCSCGCEHNLTLIHIIKDWLTDNFPMSRMEIVAPNLYRIPVKARFPIYVTEDDIRTDIGTFGKSDPNIFNILRQIINEHLPVITNK